MIQNTGHFLGGSGAKKRFDAYVEHWSEAYWCEGWVSENDSANKVCDSLIATDR